MATAANGTVPASASGTGMEGFSALAQMLGLGQDQVSNTTQTSGGGNTTQTTSGGGGTTNSTTTINPGDSSELEALLAELQGSDYSGLLEQIFQQAQGQIPGFQAAFQNAVGARSGNNGAVAAMLQRLLQQTTTSAQAQLVAQQTQNQSMRQGIGNSLMQNTRGTTQNQVTRQMMNPQTTVQQREPTTTNNVTTTEAPGPNKGMLALMLAGQGLKGLGGLEGIGNKIKGLFGESAADATGSTAGGVSTPTTSTPVAPMSGGAFGLPSSNMSSVPMSSIGQYLGPTSMGFGQAYDTSLYNSSLPQFDSGANWSIPNMGSGDWMDWADIGSGAGGASAGYDWGGGDSWSGGWADGNLFGIDANMSADPSYSPWGASDWTDWAGGGANMSTPVYDASTYDWANW